MKAAEHLQRSHQASERRACRVLSLNRNTKRRIQHKPLHEFTRVIIDLSLAQTRWGYRKVYFRLKLDGEKIGRETVRLVRQREGLQVNKKQ